MAWLVVQLAPHSRGLAVGMLTVCRFGPFTLLGLVAGVVTDRLDNRRTVIVTQTVQMFFSAVLAVITLRRPRAALGGLRDRRAAPAPRSCSTHPSRQNLTFQMVGRDELPNAVALNSSLFNTARIFGPALAGVLIAAFGAGLVLRAQHRSASSPCSPACSRCACASSTRSSTAGGRRSGAARARASRTRGATGRCS